MLFEVFSNCDWSHDSLGVRYDEIGKTTTRDSKMATELSVRKSCWKPSVLATYLFEEGCSAPAVECAINNATHSGMTMPSPTICNCCDFCLPFLAENAHCSVGGPGLGTTVGRCGYGLTCVPNPDDGFNYCRRMETACHKAQDDYDTRHASGQTGVLEERPLCDEKGKYAHFACVPTQTCFCQSDEGERIFGEVLYLGAAVKQNMHCGCSRFHEQIRRSISSGVQHPVMGPRCTSDGNYNPIQCVENKCYCVNRVTGAVQEGERRAIDLKEQPLTSLECYDPQFDFFPHHSDGVPPFNYTTPCFDNIKTRIELLDESLELGYDVNYASDVPECLPDGSFGRVAQTGNRSKICVDERGRRLEDYEAFRNTNEYETMDCKCALTSLLMASTAEHPVCCKNGNFREIQCRRGLCRCVDSDGRQIQRENADVTRLPCYKPDWKTC